MKLFNFSFFSISGCGIDLDYCDIEWFTLEMNRNHSAIFEIVSKYCISDSYDEKDIFILVLVLETVVCLHRTIQLHLLQPQWLGINLDYCDVKWLALEIK